MRRLGGFIILLSVAAWGCSAATRERLKAFFFEVPAESTTDAATPAVDSSGLARDSYQPPTLERPPARFASWHAPYITRDCQACHNAAQRMAVRDDLADACSVCHPRYFTEAVGHAPVAAGECTTCHDPHRSVNSGLLLTPVPDVCVDCHDEPEDLSEKAHAAAGVNECTKCHDPHFGSGMLLRPGAIAPNTD